ncbi:MAG: hypoxanthine phosphoribosyltransferase [Phycisphaerae bacterium]
MADRWDQNPVALKTVGDNPRLGQVLISQTQIAERVKDLAGEIIRSYHQGESFDLVIVAIMTGSLIFLADLVRAMPLPIRIAIMMVSNYPGASMESKGVKINYDVKEEISGKHVLVVDDILDTGQTLFTVAALLRERGAKSVRTCVLLDKLLPEPKCIAADFVGFQVPNKFVVGYGLDYDNLFRNYPAIAVLEV